MFDNMIFLQEMGVFSFLSRAYSYKKRPENIQDAFMYYEVVLVTIYKLNLRSGICCTY